MTQLILQPGDAAGHDLQIVTGAGSDNLNFSSTADGALGTASAKAHVVSRILLRFDLSGVPAGALVSSAVLYLTGAISFDGSMQFFARRLTRGPGTVNGGWTLSGATWHRYDGTHAWTTDGGDYTTTDQDAFTLDHDATDTRLVFSGLAALAHDALANRGGWLDLVLSGEESGETEQAYYEANLSRASDGEDMSLCPRLEVEYASGGPFPHHLRRSMDGGMLNPAGGLC